MPLIPELGRQRQAYPGEFEANLDYIVSSRTARARETLSENKNKKKSPNSKYAVQQEANLMPRKWRFHIVIFI